jgi:hypothetical protein
VGSGRLAKQAEKIGYWGDGGVRRKKEERKKNKKIKERLV